MYQSLYEYLVVQKSLSLPGIGTFVVKRTAADFDFTNKEIKAPYFSIQFSNENTTGPSEQLFHWLAKSLQTTESDAVLQFEAFNSALCTKLHAGTSLDWKGIGLLSKNPAGIIVLEPALPVTEGATIAANRVIREHAEHSVRVGEQEKTSDEMRELLMNTAAKKSYWKMAVAALLILAIAFIGYYFYTHGITVASIGNQHKPFSK